MALDAKHSEKYVPTKKLVSLFHFMVRLGSAWLYSPLFIFPLWNIPGSRF